MVAYELNQTNTTPDICILGGSIHATDALHTFDKIVTGEHGKATIDLLHRLQSEATAQRPLPEMSDMITPEGVIALTAIYDVLAQSQDGRRLHANRAVWDHIETPTTSPSKQLSRRYRELQTENPRMFRETQASEGLRKGLSFLKLATYATLLQQTPPDVRPDHRPEKPTSTLSPSKFEGRPTYGQGW